MRNFGDQEDGPFSPPPDAYQKEPMAEVSCSSSNSLPSSPPSQTQPPSPYSASGYSTKKLLDEALKVIKEIDKERFHLKKELLTTRRANEKLQLELEQATLSLSNATQENLRMKELLQKIFSEMKTFYESDGNEGKLSK